MIKFEDVKVEKIPYLSTRSNLIDYFYIIGYEKPYVKEKIFKSVLKNDDMSERKSFDSSFLSNSPIKGKFFSEFLTPDQPVVLNTISNSLINYTPPITDILKSIYPSNPIIYYYTDEKIKYEPSQFNVVLYFNNESNEQKGFITINVYTFIFYEHFTIYTPSKKKTKVFVPKAFMFISEYPYFTTFNCIAKSLYTFFNNQNSEIPLEIMMYNIVNYTPAPINKPTNYSFFPTTQLNCYCEPSKLNEPFISLDQISGYPFIDFNLGEIFKVLQVSIIIEMMVLSFLEQNIFFFSKNIELLNLIMYIVMVLNYPFNNFEYFWHIKSKSKSSIIESLDDELTSTYSKIIGFNCAYEDEIFNPIFSHLFDKVDYFIIDLDQKKIYSNYNDNIEPSILDVQEKIKKYLQPKVRDDALLIERNVQILFNELNLICQKVNFKGTPQDVAKFFIMNQRISSQNKKIQQLFYNFFLNISVPYYSSFLLGAMVDSKEEKKERDSKVGLYFPKIKRRENEQKSFFIKNDTKILDEINDEERSFYLHLGQGMKKSIFYENFLMYNNCEDVVKIPFLFAEEFLFLKVKNEDSIKYNFFDIIDRFYRIDNPNMTNIKPFHFNFYQFYQFFYANSGSFKKYYIDEQTFFSEINIPKLSNNKLVRFFNYDRFELDKNFLFKYAYNMSIIENKEILKIFPFYNIIGKTPRKGELALCSEITSSIQDELSLIKIINNNDIIFYSCFIAFALTAEKYYHQMEFSIIIELFNKIHYSLRKYLIVILSVYYRISERKLKELKEGSLVDIGNELMCYYFLLNFIRNKKIYPNEQLLLLFNCFHRLEEKKNNINERIEKDVCYKERIGEKKEQREFEIIIKEPKFRKDKEKERLKVMEILNNAIQMSIKNNDLQVIDLRQKQVTTKIELKHLKTNKVEEVLVYSPCKLFQEANRFLSEYYPNLTPIKDVDSFRKFIINIIFYLERMDEYSQMFANNIYQSIKDDGKNKNK